MNLQGFPQNPERDVTGKEFRHLITSEEQMEYYPLGEDCADCKSLKDIISGEATITKMGPGDEEHKVSSSLSQHFTKEENQLRLQLVRSKQGHCHGTEGLKVKGMVSNCVKVLSHLIKHRGNRCPTTGSKKKLVLHLSN